MKNAHPGLIDAAALAAARAERGEQFAEDLAYFFEDGAKAIAQIAEAVSLRDPQGVVRPAQSLKNDAAAFGAVPLAALAAEVEAAAYRAVKLHIPLVGLEEQVVALHSLFEKSAAVLRSELIEQSPLRRVMSLGIKAIIPR